MTENSVRFDTTPMQERLDIVQDCIDLKDKFPQNVKFNFVLWRHGMDFDSKEEFDANNKRLAKYCAESDFIAFEVASTVHKSKNDVRRETTIINSLLQYKGEDRLPIEMIYGDVPITTTSGFCTVLAKELLSYTDKIPFFIPIDIQILTDKTLDEIDKNQIEKMTRIREATVIRQLHEIANKVSKDGEEHQIAVIYGNAHSQIAVATRALGAPIKRVFVDKKRNSARSIISNLSRYNMNEDESRKAETVISIAKEAIYNTFNIMFLGATLELIKLPSEIKSESEEYINTASNLEMLSFRAFNGYLTPEQKNVYEKSINYISPYLEIDSLYNNPSILKAYRLRRSVRRLITLADEIN